MRGDLIQILGCAAGVALIGAGLWVSRAGRDGGRSWGRGRSAASLAVLGLSLAVVGYHVAGYVAPDYWFDLKVPWERAWVLGGAVVVAVGASLLMDRRGRVAEGPVPEDVTPE